MEIAYGSRAAEFQIRNCAFTYAPLAELGNSYRYIFIHSLTKKGIIDINTFMSDSGNTACYFIAITNLTERFKDNCL
ncbi:MAG: hypothetical protein VB018_11070 [Lachnospiraceae bacterium]|nr:hypothetical protein [Lachnospiraceae bacterium]